MPKGLVFNASLNRYDGGVYTSALSYNDMWCAWQHAWQAALQSGEPVVPPQWRVVMRGMVEYAECNDPGNPYLDQAKALLSAGKGGGE
jgi:hypothetical protein